MGFDRIDEELGLGSGPPAPKESERPRRTGDVSLESCPSSIFFGGGREGAFGEAGSRGFGGKGAGLLFGSDESHL